MLNQASNVHPEYYDCSTQTDLETLVERAMQGDKKALYILSEKISKGVLFQLTYILGNRTNAEDVSQEVLIRVCASIKGLRSPKAFKGWLGRIIVNEKNRFLSKHIRQSDLLNINDYLENIAEEDSDYLPHNRVENKELHQIVMSIVRRLPMRQREVVLLHYYNDMSIKEVAKSMGITTQSVCKNLAIARKKLEVISTRIV